MLRHELINDEQLFAQVQLALEEDIQSGDVTASLIPADKIITADLFAKEMAILCGKDWFNQAFKQLDPEIKIHWQANDADKITPDQIICSLSGSAQNILTAERTAINFLQTLSGTATVTKHYVDTIKETSTKILDTRKTIPGLRLAQKYAVNCGGGVNHRVGLYDMILIKENHIEAAGSIEAALYAALQKELPVEIEVETLEELQQALQAGAQRILLDNMNNDTLKLAVILNRQFSEDKQTDAAILEASGNVSFETIEAIAETGVDYISIGSLTKHLTAVDFSLRFRA